MPGFSLLHDLLTVAIAYIASAVGTLAWVYRSAQSDVPRNRQTISMVAIRLAIVLSLFFFACYFTDVAAWVPLASLLVLLLLAWGGHILGYPGAALGFIVQQYVLGFPMRRDLILTPPSSQSDSNSHSSIDQQLVGVSAVTTTALKPSGQVKVDDRLHAAISESGHYVDANTDVLVIGIRNGSLLVRED